jgi:hypothetical protein
VDMAVNLRVTLNKVASGRGGGACSYEYKRKK